MGVVGGPLSRSHVLLRFVIYNSAMWCSAQRKERRLSHRDGSMKPLIFLYEQIGRCDLSWQREDRA